MKKLWLPFAHISRLAFVFLDGFISCKIYDKRDDFDFQVVNFLYFDGDIPR